MGVETWRHSWTKADASPPSSVDWVHLLAAVYPAAAIPGTFSIWMSFAEGVATGRNTSRDTRGILEVGAFIMSQMRW
jgi:hypothetical protein